MRRELKGKLTAHVQGIQEVAKHIPMRRELKGPAPGLNVSCNFPVAKHIPMRRELKAIINRQLAWHTQRRKAHPDEKGTERWVMSVRAELAIPGRKAHPDEKGTERQRCPEGPPPRLFRVAKHIPMRRELKGL